MVIYLKGCIILGESRILFFINEGMIDVVSNHYYFVGYATGCSLADIMPGQAKKLTHLNVAFGHVEDAKVSVEHMRDSLAHIKRLKKCNPELIILLSTGGGDQHGHGPSTATDESLNQLVDSTLDVVEEFGLG